MIGKYTIESELGRGGFGQVYKGFDPSVGRPVAIKILTALDSAEMVARFRTEASATGNLHQANIITIYDSGIQDDLPFIVMEYLEGQDLQQVISSGKQLSLLDKINIMNQVGQGLQCAHENGIVHRDVKPSNIWVLPNGSVKVMDFGIARLAHENSTRLTRTGALFGTISYISPEQLLGKDADTRSDIFAYGVVFYELLSGKNPFKATQDYAVIRRIVEEQPAPLLEVAPGCPVALEKVITLALQKDPTRRYQSFTDLLLDLKTVLMDLRVKRARELFSEACELFSSERVIEAQITIRNSIDLDPINPSARELLQQIQRSLSQMSVQAQVEANLKAVEDQIARGLVKEAIVSLESALRLYPENSEIAQRLGKIRNLQEEQRPDQQRRTEQLQRSTKENHPTAASKQDQTVLVDSKATDLPPPEESDAEPPREFTRYFGAGSDEPLDAFVTILSYNDSFRVGQTVPIRSWPFIIGRSQGDLLLSEDRTLSHQHASISWSGSGFIIRDLGTPNGSYLNGRRLPPNQDEPLPLNAEIRLSITTRLHFRCDISELPDFTGQRLAQRYTLEKCLRAGRKSALYEGTDSRPVRKVAIKLLSPTLVSYPGYLEQFEREAQTAAELDHPNICKIYEHGVAPLEFSSRETKSVHYLCMQMLDGGSLAERLDAPEYTNVTSVVSWLEVVSNALNHSHQKGVVHAGLKPTSIVFSVMGVPYVTDFAIATRPRDVVRSRPILGAPDYLAPEQWDGLVAGPESDEYSLACLCYRVLTGVVPFENQLDPQARSRNFEQGVFPAHIRAREHGRPLLPPSVSSALARALSVNPRDRFPAVDDFALAFRRSLAESPASDRKPRVFVSYRREADAGWAALFADKLSTQHGLDVFIDRHRVDSARHVPEKIESAIRECDFFVCLLAKSTLESAWVREEIRIADNAGKPMIPVVQEGFRRPAPQSIPFWLKRFVPRSWLFPECAKRLLDAEEVRLFADYDQGAIEKLARMILYAPRKT